MKKHIFFYFLFFPILSIRAQEKLQTVVQKGHSASVRTVICSKDGKFAFTGSGDRSIKMWEQNTGREIRTFLGHSYSVNSLSITNNGKNLASCSSDKTAKVWEVISGKEIFSTHPQEDLLTDACFNPSGNLLVTAGYGDSARVWDLRTQKIVAAISVDADKGLGNGVSVDWSPDGKWVAFGEDNKMVNIYNTSEWGLEYSLKNEQGWCGGCGAKIDFSPDSKFLIRTSENNNIDFFDLQSGKITKTMGVPTENVTDLHYSNDGSYIALSTKRKLTIFSTTSGDILKTIEFDEDEEINKISFNNDNNIYAGCENNTTLKITIINGNKETVFSGILNQTEKGGINYDPNNYWESHIAKYIQLKNNIQLTPDGKKFVKGKSGTLAKLWDIATGEPEKEFNGHEKAVICFDFSQDGKFLLTGDGGGKAFLWDVEKNKVLKSFEGHREPLFNVKFSPDEKTILTTSWDATIIVWDITSGEKLSHIDLNNSSAYSCAFSPDGLYLISGSLGKTLDMWEPDTKKIVKTFTGHTDVVSSLSFSPNKKFMLTASWDGTARLWNMETTMMVKKFKDHKGSIQAAIFTPDGENILTAGDDRTIRLWNIQTGKINNIFEGHQAEITSLDITKDGKMLTSLSIDGVIKFWNMENGKEFYEHIHIGKNNWMAKTKEGYFNATSGARNSIHFVKGNDSYSSDQFFDRFYRPELLPQMFKKRGKTGQVNDIENILRSSPPPTLKMFGLPVKGKDKVVINLKIINNGGGIDELKFMHNGKRISLKKEKLSLPGKKGEHTIYTDTLTLVGGINTFSASGFSKERVESSVAETTLYHETSEKTSTCHIMVIGINKYKNNRLTLNFAKEDATAFAETVKINSKNLFKKIEVHALYDEQATKNNILDTLKSLTSTIQQHDVFILFYAGHGGMSDDKFFFIPTECTRLYDLNSISKEGIEASVLQMHLRKIKALKQIIIMDACHSGGAVELFALRGSLEEKAIAQLARSSGIHILASAGMEQAAKELTELGHGLFTYALLQALNGEADGSPKDGKITVYELKSYLDDQVPEMNRKYNGKPQYPYTFSKGHDFPVILK